MAQEPKEIRSDAEWRRLVRQGFVDWIVDEFSFTHYLTFNFNIWAHKQVGNKASTRVYENGSFTSGNSYRPYIKDTPYNARKLYRIWSNDNKDYWSAPNKQSWTEQQKLDHALSKLRLWNTKINQKLYGKNFYKRPAVKDEQIIVLAFPEKLHSNLHFHGFAKVNNTETHTDKEQRFLKEAENIWTQQKPKDDLVRHPLDKRPKESICPGGQLWIEKIILKEDLRKTAEYSTKEFHKLKNEEGLYITKYWTSNKI
jgi:hypothetical protein